MADESPVCAHQVHVEGPDHETELGQVCVCEAGLIHMHDCPVALGLRCRHFAEPSDAFERLSLRDYDLLHGRLMADYLQRSYVHRVRSLDPETRDAWQVRRRELAALYVDEPEAEPAAVEREDQEYEEERDRLIARRKEREAIRKEREEKTREEKARERARMGIKTVVEKAQESVAAQGNVASSYLDAIELPSAPAKKRRRRRRKSGSGAGAAPDGGATPAEGGGGGDRGGGAGRKGGARRRGRRGRKKKDGGTPPA